MRRSRWASLLTLALLGLGFWWAAGREQNRDGFAPEETVWKMIDAARGGDARSYLDCFAGELRSGLEATLRDMGDEPFADYLRQSHAGLEGLAVSDETASRDRSSLVVEWIHSDGVERQTLDLVLEASTWRVVAASTARHARPLIPWGTPVEYVP